MVLQAGEQKAALRASVQSPAGGPQLLLRPCGKPLINPWWRRQDNDLTVAPTRGAELFFAQMMYEQMSDEWKEWIDLSPIERFRQSERIFAQYLAMGGSLDPDPDPQSPFYDP